LVMLLVSPAVSKMMRGAD